MYMLLYLPYYGGESDKLFESEMYARGRGILHAIMTIINTSSTSERISITSSIGKSGERGGG